MLQTSSGSLTSGELERLMLKSLTHTGLRAVSGDSRWSSWSLLATTRSPSRGSNTQARGGVPAAVAEAAVAAPGAAGLIIWAGYGTEVTAAAGAAAAELALAESLCRQASRLNLLLSLSGRFLLFLGVTIAAAGVDELQYRLVSTLPPTVLYISLAAMPFATHVLNISYSMVAEEGACCPLSRGGGGSTVAAAAADCPPLLAPGSWGVG